MNINMKYYIVTIGSIFLALGIGIIVGFNLNYDQELSKQQSEVLSEFEDRFDSLNQEKADLTSLEKILVTKKEEILGLLDVKIKQVEAELASAQTVASNARNALIAAMNS